MLPALRKAICQGSIPRDFIDTSPTLLFNDGPTSTFRRQWAGNSISARDVTSQSQPLCIERTVLTRDYG